MAKQAEAAEVIQKEPAAIQLRYLQTLTEISTENASTVIFPVPVGFSGGGKWEAMHGGMKGFYEVRVDGPNRRHYRLFCVLERNGVEVGLGGPSIVLISGKDKPFRTKLSESDYEEVSRLGEEYRKRRPRSVAP